MLDRPDTAPPLNQSEEIERWIGEHIKPGRPA